MKPLRLTHYLLLVSLLLVMLVQMAAASPSQSAAFDEGYTITYGYAYLRGGDARLSRGQNPPLTNVLIAAPLLLKNDIVFPTNDVNWIKPDIFGFTDQFMWRVMNSVDENFCAEGMRHFAGAFYIVNRSQSVRCRAKRDQFGLSG